MSERFWWVNHSHSHQFEIDGSYLWFANKSPKSKARIESDKNIGRLLPGDVMFSFADGAVGAVGVVLGAARESGKPAELDGIAEHVEVEAGWSVPVRFMRLGTPLRTENYGAELATVLPRKHSPIRSTGICNQHILLAVVPAAMAAAVRRLLEGEVERVVETITEAVGRTLQDDTAETHIQQRSDINPARKSELLKARSGQGQFRVNLESIEHSCRVTGILDRRHLRAAHIKPWCESDDAEKLDGFNGLLLSPHVAHLFERGYISFSDAGELLVSQELNPVVLEGWSIALPRNAGPFAPEQCRFLDYHRLEVFQQHGGGRRRKSAEEFASFNVAAIGEPATVNPA